MPSPFRHLRYSALAFGATLCMVALLSGLYLSHDLAAGRDDSADVLPLAELVPDATLDARILELELDGAGWRQAVAELEAGLFAEADAVRRLESATADLLDRHADLTATDAQLTASRTVAATIEDEISVLEEMIRAWAVSRFVSFGEGEATVIASAGQAVDDARSVQLAQEVDVVQLERRATLIDREVTIDIQVRALFSQIETLRRDVTALEAEIVTARADLLASRSVIEHAKASVHDERRRASVAGYDFSVVAFDAYLKAETALADTNPECGLTWWMLAGIGRIESRHGELGGRWIRPDGVTSSPIVGIPLDGGPGVRAIVDTDGGAYDGDATWDRAVGPMQFIPETWTRRAVDGSGDGVSDPHNLYDASLATGRYLCQLAGQLDTDAGREAAFFGYNTSARYVADVERHASRYADLDLPDVSAVESPDVSAVHRSVDNG